MAAPNGADRDAPRVTGAWTLDAVHRHLDEVVLPVRLAVLAADGHPRVVSLWFEREGALLWCATQQDAYVARAIARDGRVGFEIAGDDGPYRGARGWGRAQLRPDRGAQVLRSLMARYVGPGDPLEERLLAQVATEVAIEIVPDRWFSWDFSARMGPTKA